MSILIQGMEMPKPFDHLFVGESVAGDLFVRNDTQEGDNVVWYPLVEIPPHGRLIDADAFERKVMFGDEEDLQDVIYSLRDYPSIIPADKEANDG